MPILPPPADPFAITVPVLIAGGGACGLTAALAARGAGAEVLILEKDAIPRGTTSMSQGTMCAAGTQAQKDAGIEDSPEQFFEDVMAKVEGKSDPDFVRVVTREAAPTIDWLSADHGIPFAVDTSWKGLGHSVQRLHAPPEKTGEDLLGRLLQAVERVGADLLTDANLTDLYADDSGRVLGVRIARPDGSHEDIGCGALILATCGFANNPDMIAEFIPDMAGAHVFTWENSLGDGIRWGMDLDGAVADMSSFQGYGALAHPQELLFNYNYVIDGGVQVNRNGERFSDEMADVSGQGVKVMRQPDHIAYMIYDETLHNRYKHLHETRQALEIGAVKNAETIADLASALDIPAGALQQTLTDIADSKGGKHEDAWGRDFTGTHDLAPPYYGIRVTGAIYHTQGGLDVDANAQVKRIGGGVLPNLFAGGGAARGISGPTCSGYIPASGICMAMTLGRLAGQAAARLTS
ncbi:MAG: FAD-dependent oxidoreductase [Rhodospirillaceae bacterium]|jgi:fumarate reductase flavoprotein subunit|nr:FAD-dependent oxidoreductase [Rhodospirillaceae bacterium]MBT5565805.1 FAD-dependent oxidoreductase [Rhodospirillaceae bacterium]MBT6090302.1 FAD-dependent oxidoreductase [Rhodospirillaceae bacterium]